MQLKYRNCNLCGSNASKVIFTERPLKKNNWLDFHVVRCLECGFVYVNPIYGDYSICAYLSPDGLSGRELFDLQLHQKIKINRWQLDILKSRLNKDARILDIGCGTGAFLSYISGDFNHIFGIDLSKKEVSYAQSRGLNVVEGQAEFIDKYFDKPFDAVVMSDVLEHIENPSLALAKVYALLNDKGLLLLRIPNGTFQIYKARLLKLFNRILHRLPEESIIGSGEHLSHFNVATIRRILQINMFKRIRIYISPPEFYENKNKMTDLLKHAYNTISVYKVAGLVISNAIMVVCEK